MNHKNILFASNFIFPSCKLSCQLGYTMENVEKNFKLKKKIPFEYMLVKQLNVKGYNCKEA